MQPFVDLSICSCLIISLFSLTLIKAGSGGAGTVFCIDPALGPGVFDPPEPFVLVDTFNPTAVSLVSGVLMTVAFFTPFNSLTH